MVAMRVHTLEVAALHEPITVEQAGNDAMLNFGRSLAAEEPAFTFPRARNLEAATEP